MQIQVIYKLFKSSFVIEMQEGGFSSDFCNMSVLGFDSFCTLFNFDFNSFLVFLLLISNCKLNRLTIDACLLELLTIGLRAVQSLLQAGKLAC